MTQAAKPKTKQKKMPIPAKHQGIKDALKSINKQYGEALSRLAK